jgi:hypothetical protein
MKQFDIDELTHGCSTSNGRESARKIIVRIGSDAVELKSLITDNNVRSSVAKNKKSFAKQIHV